MKLIRLVENSEGGLATKKFMCSNRVYEKLVECQSILGYLSYDVDLWDERKSRSKTDWNTIRDFLESVFKDVPVHHTQHILDFILTNDR